MNNINNLSISSFPYDIDWIIIILVNVFSHCSVNKIKKIE